MNSVAIYCFSGTGNTKTVVDLFIKEFTKQGWRACMTAVDKRLLLSEINTSEFDMIGIAFAIHAFNAPRPIFDAIKKLSPGAGKRAFIIKCPGDPLCQGGSTHQVREALAQRGYEVFHESLIVGHANVVIRFDDRLVRQLYRAACAKARIRAAEIMSGTGRLQKNPFALRIATTLFSGGESRGARWFGKKITIRKNCTLCGTCVRTCPMENIRIDSGRVRFGNDCAFCMRCVYCCPVDAVVPGFGNFLKVKRWVTFEQGGCNAAADDEYITSRTRGYFAHYRSYLSEG